MSLQKRYPGWALITGASAGIGQAFAEYLAKEGVSLFLVARRADRLNELASRLSREHGVSCEVVVEDLASREAVSRIIEKVGSREVSILVNNAGFGVCSEFCDQSFDDVRDMIYVNALAPALLTHHFAPRMRTRKNGAIIFLGSIVAYDSFPLISVYSATKGFDLMMGESLYAELKPFGVDVIAVSPGTTATEFHGIAKMRAGGSMNRPRSPMDVVKTAFRHLGRRPSAIDGTKNFFAMIALSLVPRRFRPDVLGKAMRGQAA